MIFTITIDSHDDGHYEVWSQEKENISDKDRDKMNDQKRQIKELLQPETSKKTA
jgi:hypothetical protein